MTSLGVHTHCGNGMRNSSPFVHLFRRDITQMVFYRDAQHQRQAENALCDLPQIRLTVAGVSTGVRAIRVPLASRRTDLSLYQHDKDHRETLQSRQAGTCRNVDLEVEWDAAHVSHSSRAQATVQHISTCNTVFDEILLPAVSIGPLPSTPPTRTSEPLEHYCTCKRIRRLHLASLSDL